jgi:hypothetical protein
MKNRQSCAVIAGVVGLGASGAGAFAPEPIGPDCVNSSLVDIARHGTNAAGTIVGYSAGNTTCNRGDAPMVVSPSTTVRPMVGMNLYRFVDNGAYSRFEQLGQGWCKWVSVPASGTNTTCGPSCGPFSAGQMGVNCADVYGSGFNSPAGMAPRSRVNATLGTLTGARGGGTAETNINTRVQVRASDVNSQPAGTRYFFETIHLLPDDAMHVRAGRTVAENAMNNATSQEIGIASSTAVPTMIGGPGVGLAAISRWAVLDSDVSVVTADHNDTPNPSASFPGTFVKSRFYVAGGATPLPGGLWRYEFAVFNLNSDRSCGSLTLAIPGIATVTDLTLRHPSSHSGEPFSNAAWTVGRTASALTFATVPFAQDMNANAIRWGTMYNFGFTSNAGPLTGTATLGLFKPGTISSIGAPGVRVPSVAPCPSDVDGNASVEVNDLVAYLQRFEVGGASADLDDDGEGTIRTLDGGVDINDLVYFLVRFEAGC